MVFLANNVQSFSVSLALMEVFLTCATDQSHVL